MKKRHLLLHLYQPYLSPPVVHIKNLGMRKYKLFAKNGKKINAQKLIKIAKHICLK